MFAPPRLPETGAALELDESPPDENAKMPERLVPPPPPADRPLSRTGRSMWDGPSALAAPDEIAEIDCAPKQRPLPPFDPVEPGMTWNGVPQHEAGPSVVDTFVRHAPELSCIC